MTPPCVCGHPPSYHCDCGNCSGVCMRWRRDCHCPSFHPDDGTDPGTTSVDHRADPYDGIYGTDRKWAL